MKSVILAALFAFASTAHARCVVEILDTNGDPLGHVFQGDSCSQPRERCEEMLRRLRNPEARCEVTLDIGSKATPVKN